MIDADKKKIEEAERLGDVVTHIVFAEEISRLQTGATGTTWGLSLSAVRLIRICKNILHESFEGSWCGVLLRTRLQRSEDS